MTKQVNWPTPLHFTLPPKAAGDAPESCIAFLANGKQISGELIRFSPDESALEIRASESGANSTVDLNSLKYLRLAQPLPPKKQDDLLKTQLGDEVISGSDKQKCNIEFTDGDKLTGETMGSIRKKAGLYLFILNREGKIIRYFIPSHAIKNCQIGTPIGQLLVKEKSATSKDIDLGLKKQQQLRNQRIGDYLADEQLVTREQIIRALQEQKSKPSLKLGEMLVNEKLVTQQQLDEALGGQQKDRKMPLGEILVNMGLVDRDTIKRALARKLGIPVVNLRKFNVDPNVIKLIPENILRKHKIMPLYRAGETLVVAVSDPMKWEPLDALRFYTKLAIEPVMATEEDLSLAIDNFYGYDGGGGDIGELTSQLVSESDNDEPDETIAESDNTLVRLVNKMIMDALQQGASDIHIESYPGKQNTRVRFRNDGTLSDYFEIPANYRNAVVSRIKIMCGLDISERRKPQDGKIDFQQFGPAKIELRVATIPTTRNMEDVVMRLLAGAKPVPIDDLGLNSTLLEAIKNIAVKAHGLFLICGPTGSGKTTTLHSVLSYINTPERKIWTAEDPVEITQQGLRQVQVNTKIGLTFAAAMRAFLRADPDVIMVGEMRDAETTKTGIEASLTGHLVFSTLHTNSAPESVVRLLDLGMDPFNFSDALLGVLAQRLAKRLCKKCKESYTASSDEIDELLQEYCLDMPIDPATVLQHWKSTYTVKGEFILYKACGCEECGNTGYKGRLGLHELLIGSNTIKRLVQRRATVEELRNTAFAEGLRTLKQDGIEKVLQGNTDIHQIRTVCN
ncbi:MAG: ATPase, T2SS/T4P/T4SS family [Gammaproteobacteria bacterium]|nr:ATPase, T2SS/T4P/T4SS family [Gammaproteobacteria bacterium]